LSEVDGLLGFFERRLWRGANSIGRNIYRNSFHRRGARPCLNLISPERASLKGHKPRSIATETHIRGKLPLKHLAGEKRFAAVLPKTDTVADDRSPHRGRQFRNEVTHLIGMRHQYKTGLSGRYELLQCRRERIRRVGFERLG